MKRHRIFGGGGILVFCLLRSIDVAAVEYTGRQFKDPFFYAALSEGEAPDTGEQAAAAMTVEGLLWNTNVPQAIVNGRVVQRGGKIGNAEVLDISKDGVKIRLNGNEFMLKKRTKDAL